jgi:plasmid segregation protein ParM
MDRQIMAADVGYGNTKYVMGMDSKGQFFEGLFPSIARPVYRRQNTVDASMVQQMNEVVISAEGKDYAVGPDAAISGSTPPQLHMQYPLTSQYLALTRGAMHFGAKTLGTRLAIIDLLMLGLPVSNMAQIDALKQKMTGEHDVPIANPSEGMQIGKVLVKNVRVLPQPVGALVYWAFRHKRQVQLQDRSTNLVIDIGYFTFDWFSAYGMKQMQDRSGAFNGGVSQILKEVQRLASLDYSRNLSLAAVEEGLRTGQTYSGGIRMEFQRYQQVMRTQAAELVSEFVSRLGQGDSYRNVIVTGGGADYCREALEVAFKGADLFILPDSVMANARGFYMAGASL